jgi:hypothetical protein
MRILAPRGDEANEILPTLACVATGAGVRALVNVVKGTVVTGTVVTGTDVFAETCWERLITGETVTVIFTGSVTVVFGVPVVVFASPAVVTIVVGTVVKFVMF